MLSKDVDQRLNQQNVNSDTQIQPQVVKNKNNDNNDTHKTLIGTRVDSFYIGSIITIGGLGFGSNVSAWVLATVGSSILRSNDTTRLLESVLRPYLYCKIAVSSLIFTMYGSC
ncbi:unnamed protein product [Rotaria magnacalcarata]